MYDSFHVVAEVQVLTLLADGHICLINNSTGADSNVAFYFKSFILNYIFSVL